MEKKKLLIISPSQFGYLTDYYFYCKYLKDEFNITFLCFDQQFKKLTLSGVEVKYTSLKGNKFTRYLRWLLSVLTEIKESEYDIVFSYSYKYCSVIKLITNRKIILDIRTGSVKENRLRNYLQNLRLRLEASVFDYITIISEGLINHLKLRSKNCHYLPLGAEILESGNKNYDRIKLLYVGTLNHRKIHETIDGFYQFYKKYGRKIHCEYNIFGYGTPQEEDLLNNSIKGQELGAIVKFHGRKNINEILDYYKESNIGVSYIPITPYFNFQPPTKTFEYILAGMICIGTSTYENSNIINENNGILCADSAESFCRALEKYYMKRKSYQHSLVIESLSNHTWDRIVNGNLKSYLKQIIEHD